jgi:hypothetical protein
VITPLQADGLRWQAMANAYAKLQSTVASSEHSDRSVAMPLEVKRFLAMARATQPSVTTQVISERSNGVQGPDPSLVPVTIAATSGGFDWSDAGIGASTAFGVALLLVLAVALGRRQHTGLTSA